MTDEAFLHAMHITPTDLPELPLEAPEADIVDVNLIRDMRLANAITAYQRLQAECFAERQARRRAEKIADDLQALLATLRAMGGGQ